MQVVETIVARFADVDQNRGIIRAIPDDYDGVPLNTQVISVSDHNGTGWGQPFGRVSATVTLAPGETVTVAIGFAPGTFLTPEPAFRAGTPSRRASTSCSRRTS